MAEITNPFKIAQAQFDHACGEQKFAPQDL